jgi:hypothetical protein
MLEIDDDYPRRVEEARTMRMFGEQDGDVKMLTLAAAAFFDLQMYAASARCRDRVRHYQEIAQDEPMPASGCAENIVVHDQE